MNLEFNAHKIKSLTTEASTFTCLPIHTLSNTGYVYNEQNKANSLPDPSLTGGSNL